MKYLVSFKKNLIKGFIIYKQEKGSILLNQFFMDCKGIVGRFQKVQIFIYRTGFIIMDISVIMNCRLFRKFMNGFFLSFFKSIKLCVKLDCVVNRFLI